jgi:peptide/nickel transport system substrate-binding protein
MKKNKLIILASACLSLSMVGCNSTAKSEDPSVATSIDQSTSSTTTNTKVYDNETDALVLSTQALDGVFNPFFYTSGYDGEIVSQTQISMIGTDNDGNVKVGEDEACVALDYSIDTTDTRSDINDDTDYENYYTTYRFLIKNGIKFSDGTSLTIKDILFNMYVYLDPVYSGSTTMYSTNIAGYKKYRSQSDNTGEQDNFDDKFASDADERISNILYWCKDNLPNDASLTQIKEDIEKAKTLFLEELTSDWNNAESSISDYQDTYKFTEAWQVFLYNYGYITLKTSKDDTWDGKNTEVPEALNWNSWDTRASKNPSLVSKENLINSVYLNFFGDELDDDTYKDKVYQVIKYYATGTNLKEQIKSEIKSDYFQQLKANGELIYKNIEGITTYKTNVFNGKEYGSKTYGEQMDVLQIKVNGVDPKAIWNFGFSVAPMSYYSTADQIAKYDGKENFGVDYGSKTFMDQLQAKQIPMGAGPYRASTSDGSIPNDKSRFFNSNVVFFERNDYFLLGAPKIKKLRYQVIASNKLFDSVATGTIAFADPSAQVSTINNITNNYKNKLDYVLVDNNGYGYIGINANYVHELKVRRAIMYAMDTSLVLNYYSNEMASVIYRPMSKVSWAYPEGCSAYYPYVGGIIPDLSGNIDPEYVEYINSIGKVQGEKLTQEEQQDFIRQLVEEADYTESKGVYSKINEQDGSTDTLKFTFTLAGETTDHPAYSTFANAKDLLNSCGFNITVKNDAQALSKLSAGTLTVWAAAWSSAIDPDMYQVYHKDSSASSINNWGYSYMENNESVDQDVEIKIIDDLATLIEQGRKTTDQVQRKTTYSDALDKVMELAVELPTYQRKNLYVYDKTIIDSSTLQSDITPYNGPLSRIWEVSLVTK